MQQTQHVSVSAFNSKASMTAESEVKQLQDLEQTGNHAVPNASSTRNDSAHALVKRALLACEQAILIHLQWAAARAHRQPKSPSVGMQTAATARAFSAGVADKSSASSTIHARPACRGMQLLSGRHTRAGPGASTYRTPKVLSLAQAESCSSECHASRTLKAE